MPDCGLPSRCLVSVGSAIASSRSAIRRLMCCSRANGIADAIAAAVDNERCTFSSDNFSGTPGGGGGGREERQMLCSVLVYV